MNNIGVYGQLFNTAKQYAFQIINSNPPATNYRIISNRTSANSKRLLSKESALSYLSEIEESSQSKTLQEVYDSQRDMQSKDGSQADEIFFISDFQKHNTGLNFLEDTNIRFHLIPLQGNSRSNVSIDSCWFDNPVRKTQIPEQLHFKITNRSSENLISYPVRLSINGVQKSMINIDVAANGSIQKSFSYTIDQSGIIEGEIAIDDYPISFDNRLYFSYSIPKKSNVLVVSNSKDSTRFKSLFVGDSSFTYEERTSGSFTFSDLDQKQLIILNGVSDLSTALSGDLKNWVEGGGRLAIFPPDNGDAQMLNSFLLDLNASTYAGLDTNKTSVLELEFENPLFKDAFDGQNSGFTMPIIQQHYPIMLGKLPYKVIISQANSKPFLVEQDFGKGKLYQFSIAENASFSNFSKHALFVVTFFQMGIYNMNNTELYHTLGNTPNMTISSDLQQNELLEIEGNETRFIPEVRNRGLVSEIWFYDQIKQAGLYRLLQSDKHKYSLGINYDQQESNIDFYSREELNEIASEKDHVFVHDQSFDKIGKTLNDLNFGKQLWQYMIVLALLMLVIEILLIKLWK